MDDTAFTADVSIMAIRDARDDNLNAIADAVANLVGVLSNAAEKWREDNGQLGLGA
jgi:hypothetical protein